MIKFNFFKLKLILLVIQYKYYLDRILFFCVIINVILDLINFCSSIVEHMSVFQFCNEDALMKMSSNSTGSNLPGGSGIPNSSGGSPGGLPGGNSNPEPFGSYNTTRQITHTDGN
jgi:hypothetical protein